MAVAWLAIAAVSTLGREVSGQAPSRTARLDLAIDGTEHELVPVTNVAVLSDGGVLVWQDRDARIIHFTASGNLAGSIGRAGEGPGEFRMLSTGGLTGSHLWLSDPMLRRTTTLDLDGEVLGVAKWPTIVRRGPDSMMAGLGVQPRRVLPDGTQIVELIKPRSGHAPAWWPSDGAEMITAAVDDRANLLRIIATHGSADPGCTIEFRSEGMGPGTLRVPFCPRSLGGLSSGVERLVRLTQNADAGRTGAAHLEVIDFIGVVRLRRSLQVRTGRIPRATVDSAIRAVRGQTRPPAVQRAVETALESVEVPAHYPPFERVLLGRDGTVWLRSGSPKGDSREWLILGADGTTWGTVLLPATFSLHEAELQRAWGVVLDADDIPSVHVYSIR